MRPCEPLRSEEAERRADSGFGGHGWRAGFLRRHAGVGNHIVDRWFAIHTVFVSGFSY